MEVAPAGIELRSYVASIIISTDVSAGALITDIDQMIKGNTCAERAQFCDKNKKGLTSPETCKPLIS